MNEFENNRFTEVMSTVKFIYKFDEIKEISYNTISIMDKRIFTNLICYVSFQKWYGVKEINIDNYDDMDSYSISIKDKIMNLYKLEKNNEFNLVNENQLLNIYIEIIKETLNINFDYRKNVAWELLKKYSVFYYYDYWKNNIDKFIEQDKNDTIESYMLKIYCNTDIGFDDKNNLLIFTYFAIVRWSNIFDINEYPIIIYNEIKKIYKKIKEECEIIKKKENIESIKNKIRSSENEYKNYTIHDIDLMTGLEFEDFIYKLFMKLGYKTEKTQLSNDQGIDIIATKVNGKIGIQAKCYSSSVGNAAIQEVVAGKLFYQCDKIMVITNNLFTKSAIKLAETNNVILWDRNILKEKIKELF